MRVMVNVDERICDECHKAYKPKANNQMYCDKKCYRIVLNKFQNERRKREGALIAKNKPKPIKEVVVKEPIKRVRAKKKYTPISKPKPKIKSVIEKVDKSMDYLFDSKKVDTIIVNRPCTDKERLMIDEALASK